MPLHALHRHTSLHILRRTGWLYIYARLAMYVHGRYISRGSRPTRSRCGLAAKQGAFRSLLYDAWAPLGRTTTHTHQHYIHYIRKQYARTYTYQRRPSLPIMARPLSIYRTPLMLRFGGMLPRNMRHQFWLMQIWSVSGPPRRMQTAAGWKLHTEETRVDGGSLLDLTGAAGDIR